MITPCLCYAQGQKRSHGYNPNGFKEHQQRAGCLRDKRIDLIMIQKLLGHNDIKTTLRYLHVTNKDLGKIESPIEDITSLLK